MTAPVQMTQPVQAWYADAVIGDAIRHINQHAACLREEHTRSDDRDDWQGDDETRIEYETLTHNARELRGLLVALRGPGAAAQVEPDRGDDGRGLADRALDVIRQDGGASPASLARALRIEPPRAAVLLAQLAEAGAVGDADEHGRREVRAA